MLRGFPSHQAARLAGIPYKTLDFWAKSAFIEPSIVQASGRGTDRVYSFQDVVALRVARRLREGGISLQKLRKVVRFLQEHEGLEIPFAETFLVSDGYDVFQRRGEDIVSLLGHPGQLAFAWVLDLETIVREVKERMAA